MIDRGLESRLKKHITRIIVVMLALTMSMTTMSFGGIAQVYAESEENTVTEEYPAFSQQVNVDGNQISIEAPEGVFPKDAILNVLKVSDEGFFENALAEKREENREQVSATFFDIKVLNAQGEKFELTEGQSINVSIVPSEKAEEGQDVSLYRIIDTEDDAVKSAEKQDANWNAESNTFEFSTDRFSIYAVEFTSEKIQEEAEEETTQEEVPVETEEKEVEETKTDQKAASKKAANTRSASIMVDSWTALQNAINDAPNDTNTVIVLEKDCTASSGQGRIQIPKSKIIELDLNGKTLNRNRTSSNGDGHVIEVFGNLTITDTSERGNGVIKGGYATRGGGINISSSGVCELKGGTIRDNKASSDGGGVYVHGTFKMSGGTIAYNSTTGKNSDGGGIYVNGGDGATLIITGGTIRTNETDNNDDSGRHGGGIMATSGAKVSISNALFDNNLSRKNGAAIYTEVSIDINDCIFEDNLTVAHKSERTEYDPYNHYSYYKLADTYDGGAIYVDKGAVLNINNTKFQRNKITNWAWQERHGMGGAIYVNNGTLNISDSLFEDNISWEGGAIYSKSGSTVNAVNTTFSRNKADITHTYSDSDSPNKIPVSSRGGGAIANYGTLTLDGCTITDNSLNQDTNASKGGGIYTEGALTMNNVTIRKNKGRDGGGVYVQGNGNLSIKGKMTINDNSASTGTDVYLTSSKKITIAGPLAQGSDIGVALENKFGQFSNGFSEQHPEDIPESFFYSSEGFEVILKNNEGYIERGTLDDTGKFIGWKDRINYNPSRLSGPVWMSGLSGDRYLNEINIPGTHDSSMNNLTSKGCLSGKIGAAQAKTQEEYINQQLEHGIRFFDIRMKTKYCSSDYKIGALGLGLSVPLYFIPVLGPTVATIAAGVGTVMLINDSDLPKFKDDGKNLWVCHGRSAAGTFYALDEKGNMLNLAKELDWMKAFLRDHPTETIIIDARPETDNIDDEYYKVLDRFNVIMEELTNEKNPATGESYVYWEDGKVGKKFTHWPQLKDCRGKIVLWGKLEETANKSGGIWRDVDGIETKKPKGTYQDGTYRTGNLLDFFASHNTLQIPKNVMNGQMKEFYWIEMNTTDTSFMQTPVGLARDYVLPRIFGSSGVVNESKKGTYFGWFGIDAARENHSHDVWITNFPDDLDYCKVIVESGLTGSDAPEPQTYKLLRGTTITIPGSIYEGTRADKFIGWKADVDDKIYTMNHTYRIEENVTFTAQWSDQIKTPVTVVWKDAENIDQKRPDELVISYQYDGEKEETVTADGNWTGVLTGNFSGTPTVKEIPEGYSASVEGAKGKAGYTITLTHTPDVSVNANGTITWDDRDDMDQVRPESVNLILYADGTQVASGSSSANDGWSFNLGTYPRYKDGALVAYKLVEEEIAIDEEEYCSGYTIGVEPIAGEKNAITGFNVTNTHEVTTSMVYARVEWDDDDNAEGKRPDSVKVRWMKNGEPYGDWITLEPNDESEWIVGLEITYVEMKQIAQKQEELAQKYEAGEISEEEFIEELEGLMSYTITQEAIKGYATSIELKESEESDTGSKESYYQILNTFGKHNLTFYKDSEGTEIWRQEVLADGTSMKDFEKYGTEDPYILEKEGYTFAGWAIKKSINVDSYCDKEGVLNPELDGNLVDWDAEISENIEVYPIWIRNRIHVTINPGGEDVVIDEAQERSFTANIDEKIAMRYLASATRSGYELQGWYTDDDEIWNGEEWKSLEYVSDGWIETEGWGVDPKYCEKDESDNPVIRTNTERKFNYYSMTLTAKWKAHVPADPVKENIIEATCEEDGSYDEVIYCSECDEELSREKKIIPALGHSWSAWTKFDAAQHQRICEHDASHVEHEDHIWDEGNVIKEATTEEAGIRAHSCTVCGVVKNVEIPKIDEEDDEQDDPVVVSEYTITYDLNGGTLDGLTGIITKTYEDGTKIILPNVTREGYTLLYWKGSQYQPGDEYIVTEDHTFTAQWKKNTPSDDSNNKDKKDNHNEKKNQNNTDQKKTPKTADETNLLSWLALFLVSVGMFVSVSYRRRKS